MANAGRILPISVQSFEKLRDNNCVYVDKTEYIYSLAHGVSQFFLSRPRRFGKSLFLSTLRSYWEGRKELFQGLAIERLEENNADAWKPYPVLCFDFNGKDYSHVGALEEFLNVQLDFFEKKFDCDKTTGTPEIRFKNLLINIYEKNRRPMCSSNRRV